MKYFIALFFFLLPLHAFLITFLKCKIWVNTNVLRFWKEIVLLFLFFYTIIYVLKRYKFKLSKIYENNYILWLITAFSIVSLFFILFPFSILEFFDQLAKNPWHFKDVLFNFLSTSRVKAWFLGYKYDVFFLFAVIVWFYLPIFRKNINFYLRATISSILLIFSIFIPVYLFWDISSFYQYFGYTNDVSTYNPNSCLTYSQNVEWWHNRFQATFWWPIRFSVFITIFYFLYLWAVFSSKRIKDYYKKYYVIFFSFLYLIALYNSYTKTAFLWFLVWISIFSYFTYKEVFKKVITKKFIVFSSIFISIPLVIILYIKRDLFLHLWAIINRLENLKISLNMFLENSFWHWLWIAWPASQIWSLINYDAPEQSIYFSWLKATKFLPENWYVQILLEQWFLWLGLFIWILSVIWVYLYRILKRKKDFLSIWFFSAFIAIIFMANFTHAFEESATSYLFFLLIWAYIWNNLKNR
jgi:hypothetical protein